MVAVNIQREAITTLGRLSARQQREVLDFAHFLTERKKHNRKARTHLKGDWLGSMSDLRHETTGLDLQKEANDLRSKTLK